MIVLTPDMRYRFIVREDDPPIVSEIATVRESWVENVYQVHDSDFGDTGICLDLGANIGEFSVYAASLGAEVIAVEPNLDNLDYLERNIKENKVSDQVSICNVAVSDYNGTSHLNNKRGNSCLSEEPDEQEVTVVTLEKLYMMLDIAYVDVLKIDIEGAEYEVITGASLDILAKSRYITLEFEAMDEEKFGRMMGRICSVFNVHCIGTPQRGGYIYGRRYEMNTISLDGT